MAETPLSPEEVSAIGAAVAAELAELHRRDEFHGDVRAENIIVCPDGRVWLLDRGTTKRATTSSVSDSAHSPDRSPDPGRAAASDLRELAEVLDELAARAAAEDARAGHRTDPTVPSDAARDPLGPSPRRLVAVTVVTVLALFTLLLTLGSPESRGRADGDAPPAVAELGAGPEGPVERPGV